MFGCVTSSSVYRGRAFAEQQFKELLSDGNRVFQLQNGLLTLHGSGVLYISHIRNCLGVFWSLQGKYAEAEPLYERALVIRENALGPDHPDVAMVLNNQAVLMNAQASAVGILVVLGLVLSLVVDSPYPCAPTTATPVLPPQGKGDEAETLYARAIAIGEKSLGSDHPDMVVWQSNLALLLKTRVRMKIGSNVFSCELKNLRRQVPERTSVRFEALSSILLE